MKMLYKKGSMYQLREGSVDFKVFEADEIDTAIDDGWVLNPLDLFNVDVVEVDTDELAALKLKAKEVGVPFNARTSVDTLKARLAEAVKTEV